MTGKRPSSHWALKASFLSLNDKGEALIYSGFSGFDLIDVPPENSFKANRPSGPVTLTEEIAFIEQRLVGVGLPPQSIRGI